jgi:hypothetical protein
MHDLLLRRKGQAGRWLGGSKQGPRAADAAAAAAVARQ